MYIVHPIGSMTLKKSDKYSKLRSEHLIFNLNNKFLNGIFAFIYIFINILSVYEPISYHVAHTCLELIIDLLNPILTIPQTQHPSAKIIPKYSPLKHIQLYALCLVQAYDAFRENKS